MGEGAIQGISEGAGTAAAHARWPLRPVAHRGGWIAGGLGLQLVGVGGPLAYVVLKAKHESVGGLLSVATVRLAWHGSLHTKSGVALLAAGTVLFVVGSVLLARPFVKSRLTLLLGVPVAGLVGVLVLGVVALIIGLAVAGLDLPSGGGGGSPSSRKRTDAGAGTKGADAEPNSS